MPKPKLKPKPSKAALPLLLRDPEAVLSAAALRELFAYTGAAAQVATDPREPPHDRLFGAIMARADALQARRDAYLAVIGRLQRQPRLWPVLLRETGAAVAAMLESAGLLAADARKHLQVAGLLAVLATTLRAWQTDTSTDLSATLRACDTGLRRFGTATAWLGLAP